MQDLVVVVNLNGSACRMMAQKLRAEHFYCRIVSSACAAEDIQRMGARGIVLAAGGGCAVPDGLSANRAANALRGRFGAVAVPDAGRRIERTRAAGRRDADSSGRI